MPRTGPRQTTEQWVTRAQALWGVNYDYSKVEYSGAFTSVTIICPTHGAFQKTPAEHTRKDSPTGCPACGGSKALSFQDWEARATLAHRGKYDYSKAESEWTNVTSKITIVCPVHGAFKQQPSTHVQRRKGKVVTSGCAACGRAKGSDKITRSAREEFNDKLLELWGGPPPYDLSDFEYITAHTKSNVSCPDHGAYLLKPNTLLNGWSCPTCHRGLSTTQSRPHDKLAGLLPEARHNCKSIIAPAELDMYWPESNLAVEVNGCYWHSDRHKPRTYHLDKTLACKAVGIQLLHFWDFEINRNPDLVASMINQRLGRVRKLYARKLEVVSLAAKDARAFLNKHHLQGYANAGASYGLQTKSGRLAMVMTFGKPRFNKSAEWELIRLASHQGITVVGGASRLLAAFEKDHNPSSVLTYADLRYSRGHVYRKLGFVFQHRSPPSYLWFRGCKFLSRYQSQKHKLASFLEEFDPAISEADNMYANNYVRIYDCGNLTYLKTYS